jgi:diguanylate cyclase
MSSDELTGLPNRSEFVCHMAHQHSLRIQNESWLAMVDIDGFIWANDQFGHVYGDDILRKLSKIIRAETQIHQLYPFRVGGEEFAIVAHGMTLESFSLIMRNLQYAISKQAFKYKSSDPSRDHVTISVGICAIPRNYIENATELLTTLADQIYEGKQRGSNKSYEVFCTPTRTST